MKGIWGELMKVFFWWMEKIRYKMVDRVVFMW